MPPSSEQTLLRPCSRRYSASIRLRCPLAQKKMYCLPGSAEKPSAGWKRLKGKCSCRELAAGLDHALSILTHVHKDILPDLVVRQRTDVNGQRQVFGVSG